MGNTTDEPQADRDSSRGGFTLSQEPVIAAPAEASSVALPTPAFEHLGELPESYGEDSLFLIARDPHWLFAYWDFDWTKIPPVRGRAPLFSLRVVRGDGTEDTTVEIRPESRNWYVPVSVADTEYSAELGYLDATGAWQICIRSLATRTAPDAPAAMDLAVKFATTPTALSFEQLITFVREQRNPGESLPDAVGRLTNELRTQSGGAVIDETVRAQVLAALREESALVERTWPRELVEFGAPSWPPQSFSGESSGPSWPTQSFAAEWLGPSWPPPGAGMPESGASSVPPLPQWTGFA